MRIIDSWALLLTLGLILVSVPAGLAGQEAGTEQYGLRPGRPRVSPTRADTPPRIDGVLDDDVWRTATHITDFTQQAPWTGRPPPRRRTCT